MLISVIRPVPQTAIDFTKSHEGCRLDAYLDSAGVMTVGYGHVGVGVHQGMTITQDQADDYLRLDLCTAAQRLEDAVGEECVRELTENQYAALLSFTFNVGINPKWGIVKALKAKQFDVVPGELMRFVNAGGKKVQGLVNRRAEEVKLWSTDEPGSVPSDPSSSVTRKVDTPPTANAVKPLTRSKSWFAGLATTGATALAAAQEGLGDVKAAVAPFVADSTILQALMGHLALVAAGLAVATTALLWLKQKEAKSA